MSLLRARFDECQSIAGIGATHNGGPLSEHAKRQESVDLRHPQCSLKSVESASHRKVISIIVERAREVRAAGEQPMLHSSSSAIELCRAAAPAGVWQSAAHADCIPETIRPRSEHLVARSKQQPRLAARRNPQIKRNQVKSSDQKRAGHTQSM